MDGKRTVSCRHFSVCYTRSLSPQIALGPETLFIVLPCGLAAAFCRRHGGQCRGKAADEGPTIQWKRLESRVQAKEQALGGLMADWGKNKECLLVSAFRHTCKYATKRRPLPYGFSVGAISCHETVCFELQYGLFRPSIRPVSEAKTGRFATR